MVQEWADADPWMRAMRRGDFSEAWRISDGVLQARLSREETCWHWPRHCQFIWRGVPLAGRRVLVRCYHGLGDTIQYIRFAAPLRRVAARVTVWVQPALLPLIVGAPGVDEVVPLADGDCPASYDVDVEIMELPHILRIDATSLTAAIPYLRTKPQHSGMDAPADRSLAAAAGKRRVGFVWQAGAWDPRRSVPTPLVAALLERLTRTGGIAPFLLQRGVAPAERAMLDAPDIGSDDVMVTATRMRALDLVVSVDTMAAHLAGALGVPVFTLLHANCDWRWMDRRSETPWYPSMRLFRQTIESDWRSPIAALEQALAAPL